MRAKGILLLWSILFSFVCKGEDTLVTDTPTNHLTDTSFNEVFYSDTIDVRKFRDGYKEKYGGDDFNYQEKAKEKSAWVKFLERLFKNTGENISGGFMLFFIWLIRVIVLICILYGVYILVSVLMGKEGAWFFSKKSDAKGLTYGITEEDIAGTDYLELLDAAVANQDFRTAVRYYYLYTLQKLSGQGHIDFHRDKTNTDYRYEIKDKKLAGAFNYVSYIYDYTWYGAFDMSASDYSIASDAFDDTLKMI